jgi:uncharacterized protein
MAEGKNEALKIAHKLLEVLRQNGVAVSEAFLFGSFAQDKAAIGSDIDLALISDEFCGIRFLDIKRIALFINQIDNRLEVHTFSSRDKNESLFLQEIMSTGIKVA